MSNAQTRTFKTYDEVEFSTGAWDSDTMLSADEVTDLEPLLMMAMRNGDTVVEHRGATLTWTPFKEPDTLTREEVLEREGLTWERLEGFEHSSLTHPAPSEDRLLAQYISAPLHTHPVPTWVYALLFTNALLILVGLALVLWR